jgi:hypothetical protein
MDYLADTIDWHAVHAIDAWLDAEVANEYRAQPLAQDLMRVVKVAEELGEAIQCLIGMTGQNPRKGKTHRTSDLLNELADVVFTGILAMQHFTKDPNATRWILIQKLADIERRVPVIPGQPKTYALPHVCIEQPCSTCGQVDAWACAECGYAEVNRDGSALPRCPKCSSGYFSKSRVSEASIAQAKEE